MDKENLCLSSISQDDAIKNLYLEKGVAANKTVKLVVENPSGLGFITYYCAANWEDNDNELKQLAIKRLERKTTTTKVITSEILYV